MRKIHTDRRTDDDVGDDRSPNDNLGKQTAMARSGMSKPHSVAVGWHVTTIPNKYESTGVVFCRDCVAVYVYCTAGFHAQIDYRSPRSRGMDFFRH